MRPMSATFERSTLLATLLAAAVIQAACAANQPHLMDGADSISETTSANTVLHDGYLDETNSSDSIRAADYDAMFLEIHSHLTAELRELEKSGTAGTRLAEVQSIVITAEEFYLEGKPLIAIKLLTEAELLLKRVP
jgi:hypothetical protein